VRHRPGSPGTGSGRGAGAPSDQLEYEGAGAQRLSVSPVPPGPECKLNACEGRSRWQWPFMMEEVLRGAHAVRYSLARIALPQALLVGEDRATAPGLHDPAGHVPASV